MFVPRHESLLFVLIILPECLLFSNKIVNCEILIAINGIFLINYYKLLIIPGRSTITNLPCIRDW